MNVLYNFTGTCLPVNSNVEKIKNTIKNVQFLGITHNFRIGRSNRWRKNIRRRTSCGSGILYFL